MWERVKKMLHQCQRTLLFPPHAGWPEGKANGINEAQNESLGQRLFNKYAEFRKMLMLLLLCEFVTPLIPVREKLYQE